MANETADEVEGSGEQEELDQIEAPFGVIEAMKLYEAAIPHYVAAAARLASASRMSSTRTALTANSPD